MIPAVALSGRARCFAATAVAAPVRWPVIHVQSITAYGAHVSTSFRMISPEMYGRPRGGFAGFPPTHFTPADRIPPT